MMLDRHIWPATATVAGHHLWVGGCDLVELAAQHGTPLYLLDEATLRGAMRAYRAAFAAAYQGEGEAFTIHYAGKALLNVALAQIVAQEGLGLDVVSGTELLVARRAGMPMERLHFHGNAKSRFELERALEWGVGAIVVDNLDELAQLAALSAGRTHPQGVLLRFAPNIDAHTHAYIATGHSDSKFGLPLEALDVAAERLQDAPGLRLLGLHAHIGSQLFEADAFEATIGVLLDLAVRLHERHGLTVSELSPGGGLGVPYTAEMPATDIQSYATVLSRAVRDGCAARGLPLPRLTIEPGRSIVARAGVALYTIVGRKLVPGEAIPSHLHIDGGMADNIRPALYGARYTALLAGRADEPPTGPVEVSGRFCESGDLLLHGALLPEARAGDLLAVAVAGAYTLSMASNYNLVPRPPLLLVGEGRARVIVRRETEADLLIRECPLESL